VAALGAVLLLVAPACRRTEIVVADGTRPLRLSQHYNTQDAADTYEVQASAGAIRVVAPPTNVSGPDGSDTRSVLWPTAAPTSTNQQSCVSWTGASHAGMQQGLALRVRSSADRFQAIVVAKNVWYGAAWQMNVYTWDTGRRPYFGVHGAVPLQEAYASAGPAPEAPWRVCARVDLDQVRIKGWWTSEPEPAWDDPAHTGAVRLPLDWVYAGTAGWYAGHVEPGGWMQLGELRTTTRQLVSDGRPSLLVDLA
jgi:hypothetical protein